MDIVELYLSRSKEEPKKKALTVEQIKRLWLGVGQMLSSEFDLNEVSQVICRNIFESDKGLIVAGSKGIGKTFNLDIYRRICIDIFKMTCEAWETKELEIIYKSQGAGIIEQLAKLDVLILNDVGLESAKLNDFGTERNIVSDLLYLRYRAYQTDKKKTYLTTNLNRESLTARYGDRLDERFREMFTFIVVTGDSKR